MTNKKENRVEMVPGQLGEGHGYEEILSDSHIRSGRISCRRRAMRRGELKNAKSIWLDMKLPIDASRFTTEKEPGNTFLRAPVTERVLSLYLRTGDSVGACQLGTT